MRALVLSGGGAKGAYQCGALSHLLGDRKLRYELICGVSVGALNGAFLAQYPLGKEAESVHALEKMWRAIDTEKVYKSWSVWGKLAALWKPSVYDSRPLHRLVRANLDAAKLRTSGRKLRVGAVSLDTGVYRTWDTGVYRTWSERDPDIVDAVLASSAFPAMLTPVRLLDQLWTDGGARDVSPVDAALREGASEVDVIVCSPPGAALSGPAKRSALDVARRTIEVMADEITEGDLRLHAGYATARIRVLRPKEQPSDDSLDFDPRKISAMIEHGRRDARDMGW